MSSRVHNLNFYLVLPRIIENFVKASYLYKRNFITTSPVSCPEFWTQKSVSPCMKDTDEKNMKHRINDCAVSLGIVAIQKVTRVGERNVASWKKKMPRVCDFRLATAQPVVRAASLGRANGVIRGGENSRSGSLLKHSQKPLTPGWMWTSF